MTQASPWDCQGEKIVCNFLSFQKPLINHCTYFLILRFPKRPEALVSSDQLEERKKVLETYLQNLVKIRTFRNHHETVSNILFIE